MAFLSHILKLKKKNKKESIGNTFISILLGLFSNIYRYCYQNYVTFDWIPSFCKSVILMEYFWRCTVTSICCLNHAQIASQVKFGWNNFLLWWVKIFEYEEWVITFEIVHQLSHRMSDKTKIKIFSSCNQFYPV